MNIREEDACRAAYLKLTTSALEYYYKVLEQNSSAEEVFKMLQERFQPKQFKNGHFFSVRPWNLASQRSVFDLSDHDTLQILFKKPKCSIVHFRRLTRTTYISVT